MMELAARFSETLYRGPLAHEVAQAGGAVKGQDKRALNRTMTVPPDCAMW